jgi:hypothetical protein
MARFLYVRLLSLRRLLMVTTKRGRRTSTHMLSGAAQSSLDEEVIQRCCTLCAETASRLIETLHENLNTLYRSSGWHSVYCEYNIYRFLSGVNRTNIVKFASQQPQCYSQLASVLMSE